MKATFQSGNLSIEVEGEKQKDVFGELARAQEVFQHPLCGKCKGEEIRFVVRHDKEDNDYYEMHCQNIRCRARLAFGQHKTNGTLFPRRKDKEGEWLPDNGWMRFNKETGKEE